MVSCGRQAHCRSHIAYERMRFVINMDFRQYLLSLADKEE